MQESNFDSNVWLENDGASQETEDRCYYKERAAAGDLMIALIFLLNLEGRCNKRLT